VGDIRSDKNAVAIGADGVNFVATATRVIAKG
jgi:hypothetical protein